MKLKVHGELGRIVVKKGLEDGYRLWLILRAQDGEGKGWIEKDKVAAMAGRFGIPARRLRKALSSPFFRIGRRRVFLVGLGKIAEALGCRVGKPVWVDSECLFPLRRFRAALYAAWLAQKGEGVMISRKRLEELWGRTRQTLRQWERLAGVEVKANYARCPWPTTDDTLAVHIPSPYKMAADGVWFQLPNRYVAPLDRASYGMARKVDRALALSPGEGYPRLYYHKASSLARAIQAGQQAAYLFEEEKYGVGIWALVVGA